MMYFTADTHYGHANIARGDSKWSDLGLTRPFDSIQEHDAALIAACNAVCGPYDTLYHLGDFCWARGASGINRIWHYRRQLHVGRLHLVLGNHDDESTAVFAAHLEGALDSWAHRMAVHSGIQNNGYAHTIILDHYAGRTWNLSQHGSWQLYGHSHGMLADDPNLLQMDVGVDTRPDWRPYSLPEVIERMQAKEAAWQRSD